MIPNNIIDLTGRTPEEIERARACIQGWADDNNKVAIALRVALDYFPDKEAFAEIRAELTAAIEACDRLGNEVIGELQGSFAAALVFTMPSGTALN